MDNIIEKTKELINSFEKSDLIKNLDHYKGKVLINKELLELINKYNNTQDEYEKISLKQKIYKYEEYSNYMKYYNELFYYVLKINNKYKEYTDVRGCKNESN